MKIQLNLSKFEVEILKVFNLREHVSGSFHWMVNAESNWNKLRNRRCATERFIQIWRCVWPERAWSGSYNVTSESRRTAWNDKEVKSIVRKRMRRDERNEIVKSAERSWNDKVRNCAKVVSWSGSPEGNQCHFECMNSKQDVSWSGVM